MDIERGDSSSASFLAFVEECISERKSRRFEEGLNTKVKLDIYKRFGKSVEFKKQGQRHMGGWGGHGLPLFGSP